jgi:acyl carrier protein
MAWSTGWWKRFPSAVAIRRASLGPVLTRILDGRPLRPADDPRMRDVEPILRRVVMATFGVKSERIDGHATLSNDLGIDPLDIIDLVTRVEAALGVAFPEGELEAIQTFDDLVIVTRALLSVQTATEHACPPVRVRLRSSEDLPGVGHTLERVVELTPYDCETIAEDIATARSSQRHELFVPADAPADALARIDEALLASRLGGRRTIVRRADGSASNAGKRADVDRSPATNAAALRIARHAVDLLDCLKQRAGLDGAPPGVEWHLVRGRDVCGAGAHQRPHRGFPYDRPELRPRARASAPRESRPGARAASATWAPSERSRTSWR